MSLLIHPQSFISRQDMIYFGLVLIPALVGLVFSQWGKFLRRHNKKTLAMDSFLYGYLFAFCFGVVRVAFRR